MPARRQTLIDSPSDEPTKDESPKSPKELRKEACEGILQIAQFGCMTFGLFADAGAIGFHGPPLINEAVELAEQNKTIAKRMDLLVEVGPYAGIIGVGIPFVAQILVNHGLIKAELFANAGVVHPEQLEADMKAQMMEKAMAAMNKQRETEERLMALREEMSAKANANGNNHPVTDTDGK
jgi:hypothetical protein